ncbi:FAD-dependent oxidoreductase [Streptomyces fragilis]|uniref:Pyridine nucleotide-disulfide oxidoreductase n=1 Tax=Streptomyces fragilis TaxID=67301 RepID=A0ABV2YIW1_9ACTN|nr:pyridine nucleotide-disulfide oxidoreductase [Streptomyces fragilis]
MARRAVVIGAGLGGLLSAVALIGHVDEIVVVERDELPDAPAARRGLPQGRHAHILLPSGREAIEALLPGLDLRQEVLEAGGREISLLSDAVMTGPAGWFRRWPGRSHRLLTCSRDFLDWTIRRRVLAHPTVRLRRATVTGLSGGADRVEGVRTGAVTQPADLVVDASGRGSRVTHWLSRPGTTTIPARVVDAGLVYASRVYRVPAGAEDFPLVLLQARPDPTAPSRSAALVPVEGGRWIVSLSGSRGGEPPAAAEDFVSFALRLRHPLVGQVISGAVPLSRVSLTRSTRNGRRYYERAAHWPDGLVVLGDAVASFNPVYGQGMSVAALSARALMRHVTQGDIGKRGFARRVQRAIGREVDAAWALSTSQDRWVPAVRGDGPSLFDRLLAGYTGRMARVATSSSRVSAAMCDVTTLRAKGTSLLRPSLLAATVAGPRLPPLDGPPLTEHEWSVVRSLDRTARRGGG